MIGLLFASLCCLGMFPPKVEFFPQNEPQYVNVYIDMPIGTDIEETNRVTQEVEHGHERHQPPRISAQKEETDQGSSI